MLFLIYGHRGWIGQQLITILNNQHPSCSYVCGNARVDDLAQVLTEIHKYKPTHIICLIGRTHGTGYTTIDYLEQEGKLVENLRDNLFSPLVLAILCREHKIHLTYMGTGCIFEYDALHHPHSFTEQDVPNFMGSSYSVVKGFTDRLMHLFEDCVLNVRIRMPITNEHHPRNFISKIIGYEKICSIPNSMTVLPELLPIMIDMCQKQMTGTINLVNPNTIEHNEILQLYQEIVDPSFTWTNFSIEEQNQILASKRSNNELDTSMLQSLYPNVKDIKSAVTEMLRSWTDGK